MKTEYQTRNVAGSLRFFETFKDAMIHAEIDESVWKVSFSIHGERIRLVRIMESGLSFCWRYEPILSYRFDKEVQNKKEQANENDS